MFEDQKNTLKELQNRLARLRGRLDIAEKEENVAEFDAIISSPGFWDNKDKAQGILTQRGQLSKALDSWRALESSMADLETFLEMGEEEGDEQSVLPEIMQGISSLQEKIRKAELAEMLSGEMDPNNAIVTIHPGAGGTESQDWAQMLLRMYLRWAEKNGFKTEIIDYQPGEEAGIKSVTFLVSGECAYGYIKAEAGIHRLVRISPFDANKRRHTSFAALAALPEIDENIEVDIDEGDLRIDTFRSSGSGGQHVNVTDSAVRITHIPTGIVVQCQNERSQHKNKASAMKVLRARLYELEKEKLLNKREDIAGEKKEIAWGSQIRSYVLHPYRMAKDTRTGMESGNVDAVLDGDLNSFIEAFLLKGKGEK
ncbi:MAG: peptide chain release factor 2 [Nitrospinae bacterium]|nr:peptide chain release factor 2 [Nitrospinota bacterium]